MSAAFIAIMQNLIFTRRAAFRHIQIPFAQKERAEGFLPGPNHIFPL
jgi:hypothetical protein